MEEIRNRCEIEKKNTWNLESMYADDSLWEQDYRELEKDTEAFAGQKGRIAADITVIPQVLDAYYALYRRLSKLSVYARMRSDQDTADSTYLTMASRAGSLAVKVSAVASFLEPEILGYSEEELTAAIKQQERMGYYRRKIEEMLRTKQHTLSAEQEKLLAGAGDMADAPYEIFNVLMNADMKYPDIVKQDKTRLPLTNSNYISYMESDDREIRKAAFETMYGRFEGLENTFAAIYSANLKQAKFYAEARKYPSARAMYLADSNIPETVYDSLIEAVHQALPAMYRYVKVRKRVLGVDELHMYDVYVPIFKAQNQTYAFETARQMVLDGLAPMGEAYLSHIREGFENRWIDIYPNKGKRGGAYSWGCYDSQPFILMNYTGNLDSVFTLAHELGHSIHSYYSKNSQDFPYADYKIFVAEVASTCNEALLMHDLLSRTTDRTERCYLLNHYLSTFKGTIFRQTMFAEFEKLTHEMCAAGKPLTAEALNGLYLELNRKYFGPDMISDHQIGREWMRIPHFYTPFYVYQYATGYSAAVALSARILKEGKPAVDAYMSFLKGGCSKDPIDLLKMAGVDMTTSGPVEEALALFEQLVGELEELI